VATEVKTVEELKAALKSDTNEIIILDEGLAQRVRAVGYFRRYGPFLLPAIVFGIGAATVATAPLGGSGGVLAMSAVAASASAASGVSVASIVAMVVAIGGSLVIGLCTDWEEVSIAGLLTLKRKAKK
jgi:hypothetical protein